MRTEKPQGDSVRLSAEGIERQKLAQLQEEIEKLGEEDVPDARALLMNGQPPTDVKKAIENWRRARDEALSKIREHKEAQ